MAEHFLEPAEVTPRVQKLYDDDIADDGYIWNSSRINAYQPDTMQSLFDLASTAFEPSGLGLRQRGILILAATSTVGDSYCSLAWGRTLADATDPALVVAVLTGTDTGLTDQEAAMARWARKVAKDPNATDPNDIQLLRDAGLSDVQIHSITLFLALRLAMATVDDALGVHPDARLAASLPKEIVNAVSFGRVPKD